MKMECSGFNRLPSFLKESSIFLNGDAGFFYLTATGVIDVVAVEKVSSFQTHN